MVEGYVALLYRQPAYRQRAAPFVSATLVRGRICP